MNTPVVAEFALEHRPAPGGAPADKDARRDNEPEPVFDPLRSEIALDVTRDVCPMTYVRTRLALDRLSSGQVLAVTLRGEEPARQVPASAARQGHEVLSQQRQADGTLLVRLRRK